MTIEAIEDIRIQFATDGPCHHVKVQAQNMTIETLATAIRFAKKRGVANICISGYETDTLLKDIEKYIGQEG